MPATKSKQTIQPIWPGATTDSGSSTEKPKTATGAALPPGHRMITSLFTRKDIETAMKELGPDENGVTLWAKKIAQEPKPVLCMLRGSLATGGMRETPLANLRNAWRRMLEVNNPNDRLAITVSAKAPGFSFDPSKLQIRGKPGERPQDEVIGVLAPLAALKNPGPGGQS